MSIQTFPTWSGKAEQAELRLDGKAKNDEKKTHRRKDVREMRRITDK